MDEAETGPAVLAQSEGEPRVAMPQAADHAHRQPASGRLPTTGADLHGLVVLGGLLVAAGSGLAFRNRTGQDGPPPGETPAMFALVRDRHVLWRQAGGGRVVVLPASGPPVVLAGFGSMLWRLLEAPLPVHEVVGALVEASGLESGLAVRSVLPTLDLLYERGLVEQVDLRP
ncbi:MAG: PqqD family protein [Acidimicrobiales bacterium]